MLYRVRGILANLIARAYNRSTMNDIKELERTGIAVTDEELRGQEWVEGAISILPIVFILLVVANLVISRLKQWLSHHGI